MMNCRTASPPSVDPGMAAGGRRSNALRRQGFLRSNGSSSPPFVHLGGAGERLTPLP